MKRPPIEYLVAPSETAAIVAGGLLGWRRVGPGLWMRPDRRFVPLVDGFQLLGSDKPQGVVYVVAEHLDPVTRLAAEKRGHVIKDIRLPPQDPEAGQ